ncbi:hypothetical protein ACJMK2_010123 [Sinanodonta woodiana]|uniref:AAA+ ATPase domain-containing protein n=1 Tax=Sinanodonta woodiana TaxID=1069815 RepID=A0ABD3VED5_SINWO
MNNMWTVSTKIPLEILNQGLAYKYKVNILLMESYPRLSKVVSVFVPPEPVYSDTKRIKLNFVNCDQVNHIVLHDEMKAECTVEGYVGHCRHVLDSSMSQTATLNDSILQVEMMQPHFQLLDSISVIQKLAENIPSVPSEKGILFAIIILNVLHTTEKIIDKNCITKEKAHVILQSCGQKRISELKVTSVKRFTELLKILCQIVCSKDYCPLHFIHKTYSFLGEEILISEVNGLMHRRVALCGSNMDISVIQELLIKIIPNEDFSDIQVKLLDLMFRHLPAPLALQGFVYMDHKLLKPQNNNHQTICDKLHSSVQDNVKACVKEAVGRKCIIEIHDIWVSLVKEENTALMTRKCLEEAIVKITETMPEKLEPNVGAILWKLCMDRCLFQEKDDQHSMLQALANSKVKLLHELFIRFAKEEKFQSCLREAFELLHKWLKTTLNYNLKQNFKTREEGLCFCYEYLHDALSLLKLPQDDECRKQLNNIFMECFSKLDIKAFLRRLEDIEKLEEKKVHVMELYQEHTLLLLSAKYKTNRPEEILLAVCGTSNVLRVNSRPTALIIQSIMILYGNMFEGNDLESFTNMVKNHTFWKVLIAAEGKNIDKIRDHEIYMKAVQCVSSILKHIEQQQIPCCYVEQLMKLKNINIKDIHYLLVHLSKKTEKQVEKLWNEATSLVHKERENVKLVRTVLSKIKAKIPSQLFLKEILELDKHLRNVQGKLQEGKCSNREVREELMIWQNCEVLPKLCFGFEQYIASDVFWNSCLAVIETVRVTTEKKLKEYLIEKAAAEKDSTGIVTLFGDQDDDDIHYPLTCSLYVRVLYEEGSHQYRQNWMRTYKDTNVPMKHVLNMFKNANIMEEMKLAESFLNIQILTNVHLERFHDRNRYVQHVKAMKNVLPVFQLENMQDSSLLDAINCYDGHEKCDFQAITWAELDDILKTIMEMASLVDEPCVKILQAFTEASSLVKFLREVADVDLRNLIESVEEVSEQFVNEATVSGLIDVKRFLQPFLKEDFDSNIELFFKRVSEQSANVTPKDFVLKLQDCQDNLHNLISLYRNISNRGEITREAIENVNKRGMFCFEIKVQELCVWTVQYTQNRMKRSLTQDNLIDLKSRALMLMNTENKRLTADEKAKKRESLDRFVKTINVASEISQLLTNLHQSGHLRFETHQEKKSTKELLNLKNALEDEYSTWCEKLQTCRDKYYYMNFIYGNQIHTFYMFLQSGKGHQKVLSMLRFIHPEIHLQSVREYYCTLKSDGTESNILQNMGLTIEFAVQNLKPVSRSMPESIKRSSRITDRVIPGQITLVVLEESSSLVARTVMALYNNTTKKFPECNQVIFCNENTSWIEIKLLLQRCTRAQKAGVNKALFCIANVEMLPNELQFLLVEALQDMPAEWPYLFAIVCRGTAKHPFVNEFSDSVRPVHPISDTAFETILQMTWPNVSCITSDVPGLGKTETIRQRAHLRKKRLVTLHISGPINKAKLVERLLNLGVKSEDILHIDAGNVDNPMELDAFLFEIVVLGFSSAGRSFVHLPTSSIYIEIANTIGHQLKDKLTTAISFKRENFVWQNYDDFIVGSEVNSPVQVVCHYLSALKNGTVDSRDIYFSGKKAVTPLGQQTCKELLQEYFPGPIDMSFTIARIFINVLADQLKKLSCSVYFRCCTLLEASGADGTAVKHNLVLALIRSSSEFASRSINSCRFLQASAVNMKSENALKPKGESKTESDQSYDERVKGMIRWEDSNHLIFVFHSQDIQTVSAMYRNILEVPRNIKDLFERQVKEELPNFSTMLESKLQDILQRVARTNPKPLPQSKLKELANDYALTPDNLLKMVLIMLRVRAHVPVIIMGETGCGKTCLLHYLSQICDVSFKVIQIHAGVEEKDIVKQVTCTNEEALNSLPNPVWLFLDEINTCSHLGLICDIVCHHQCLGHSLAPNLVIMAACNPYKWRRHGTILTAGLQGKVKIDALSHLVYRVFPLPETMLDYVWDFGSISEKDEKRYIHCMIQNVYDGRPELDRLLAELVTMSQRVTRAIERSESCVSLRDVNRCKILAKWFPTFLVKLKDVTSQTDFYTECIIMSLAHCYHSRFSDASDRKKYREEMAKVFISNKIGVCDEDSIRDVIIRTQRDILEEMELPAGTAKNTALQENVFVILVCILNRIPIFIVGKPGCSKSLSMQVIRSNLRGKDSKKDLFRSQPQLYCVSFQGSDSSTSDGIIKVFEKAQRYQDNNDPKEVLSVVILDEIGLAERSKFNPLKVLHSLLEPAGKSFPEIAVVGISNWALDAAKMNRAIYLSRPDMDEKELFETGKSISKSFDKKSSDDLNTVPLTRPGTFTSIELDEELYCFAKSYLAYEEGQTFPNFHGLRDYYSLVKYISRYLSNMSCSDLNEETKMMVIAKGLQRNFAGLPSEFSRLHKLFEANLPMLKITKVPVLDLIVENIQDKMARHLMLITFGDAALDIVEQELEKLGRERILIYGSQFEEDQTDDFNYRILNKIIICMEQGFVLILKDLENIYGSLYDMLNQNYTMFGEMKKCRVALGPHSNSLCHVHEEFRCIVIVEENKLHHADPPFLNRFEKHNLKFADVLSQGEVNVIKHLESIVEKMTGIQMRHFKPDDVFPIFGPDMIPSLVHKCYIEMDASESDDIFDEMSARCFEKLLWIMKPEAAVRLPITDYGRDNETDVKEILDDYFKLPIHDGLQNLLKTEISQHSEKCTMFMIFTNSNIHTSVASLLPDIPCQSEKLGSFKSEKQMTLRIQQFLSDPEMLLLVLQCRPSDDGTQILLARNTIERLQKEYLKEINASIKHVCMIMHMDRMESGTKSLPQINFLTSWKLIMVDSLQQPTLTLPTVYLYSLVEMIKTRQPLDNYIREQLFWAFTRIQYSSNERGAKGIKSVMKKIHSSKEFLGILDMFILNWIEKQSELEDKNWQIEVSCDSHLLFSSSTFSNALDDYIKGIINDPLAKILFELEKKDSLETFFRKDASASLQEVWRELFTTSDIISIADTPKPTGTECYTCYCPFLNLRVPFFRVIYEKIENTKQEFMKSLHSIKSAAGVEDTRDLPDLVLQDLVRHHERVIAQEIPEIVMIHYENWNEDYQHDFFNVTSNEIVKVLPKEERINALKWCLMGEKRTNSSFSPDSFVANMHATFWMHDDLIRAELQLIEMCLDILKEENISTTQVLQRLFYNGKLDLSKAEPAQQLQPGYESISAQTYLPENIEQIKLTENKSYSIESSESKELDLQSVIEDEGFSSEECPTYNTLFRQNETDGSHTLSGDEITDLQDEMHQLHSEILVKNICRLMLPTKQNLKTNSDISAWHQRASIVISLALEVSMDPSMLYALRFCCDIAVHIAISKEDASDIFVHMGSLLQQGCQLDDPKIRDLMTEITKFCDCKDNRLKVIAMYCSRCIGAKPNTDVIDWMMDFIAEESLLAHEIVHLKYPIHHAVMTDLNSEPGLVMDILDTEQNLDDILALSPFLIAINRYLKTLVVKSMTDSPFPAVLVDILEHDVFDVQFKDSEIQKIKPCFIQASRILEEEAFSLRHSVSVACVKSFLAKIVKFLEDKKFVSSECEVLSQTLNAALSKSYQMQVFFLKFLGRNKWIYEVQRICEKISDQVACMSDLKWKKDFNYTCVEASPVSLQVSKVILESFTSFYKANSSDMLNELVKKAMSSSENMVCLYSSILSDFYLKKTISELNDTDKSHSLKVINIAKELEMVESQRIVLECLCGTRAIKVEKLQLHEEATGSQKDLAAFISHLIVILMGFASADGKPLSFYSICLTNPKLLTECYVPGIPDVEEDLICTQSECQMHIDSGRCYRFVKDFENKKPVFTTFLRKANVLVKFKPQKGCQEARYKQSVQGLRQLSQLTYHVLQCLLYGCLAGSIAVGFSSVEDVSTLLHKPLNESEELPDFIMEILKEHMTSLSSCLGLQQHDAVVFFHAVLHETKDMVCFDTRRMTTAEERQDWEYKFVSRIDNMVKQRFSIIHQIRKKQNDLFHLSRDALENFVQEVVDTEEVDKAVRIPGFSSVWRLTNVPSLENLLSEMVLQGKEDDFQFLYLVLKNLPLIELIKNILPILNWHLISVIHASYHLKKKDAFIMRVTDFICRESDDKRRELIKDRFEKYKLAIANIIEKRSILEAFDPDFPKIEHAHDGLQLKLCLFDDEHSQLCHILSTLVSLQNTFIDETLKIAVNANPLSLNFLRVDSKAEIQCAPLSGVTSRDIISFEWKDSFLLFSHCDVRYGYGQRILHDFEKIETSLANSILTCKKYLLMKDNLPSIMYADELFLNYVHMVHQVRKVIKQLPLPSEVAESIRKKKKQDPRQVPLLLTHTGILMSLLKNAAGDPETPLVDYVEDWKNILTHPFPKHLLPSPENSIKLCHIVSLHELLEELNAESIIDSLDSRFRANLNPHAQKEVSDILSKNKDLTEVVFKAVKLFVHRCLSSDDADETQVMISYMGDASFWPTGMVKDGVLRKDGFQLELCRLFSDVVKVHNVYQVWQLCRDKVEEFRRNEQHPNLLLHPIPNRNNPIEMQTARKKAAKKYNQF